MNPLKGRAAGYNIANRFERTHLEPIELDIQYEEEAPPKPTAFYLDTSKTILSKNESPDLDFTYSINPYRGCEHGCIYCYARPSHEYLGFSAGLDFETKIMVKMDAPELLRQAMSKKGWEPQMVAFSGNTDCYQPVERKLNLTRQCLEVFLNFRNPVGMITKNALLLRDVDLLQEMARLHIIHVMISVTTLNPDLVRRMEPRTSTPAKRLEAIEGLAKAGVPVGVNIAPVIPGLTDEEIPAILKAAADRGALSAGYILLRLPGAVEPLFLEWVQRELPDRASRIINRIKDTRKGSLSDIRFGKRMSGEGEIAGTIQQLFTLHVEKHHLSRRWSGLSIEHFVRSSHQIDLFPSEKNS